MEIQLPNLYDKQTLYESDKERLQANAEKWIKEHNAYNMTAEQVAKAMMKEAINNTHWDEETYPNIKKELLKIIDEYDGEKAEN